MPTKIQRVRGAQAESAQERLGLVKITKNSARFLFDHGIPFVLIGNNVNAFHFFDGWHLAFEINPPEGERSFDGLVGNWAQYNENSETGKAAFFTTKANFDNAVKMAASSRAAAPKATGPKKRRKSSPGSDTVRKRRILRAAAERGVKLSPAQVRAAMSARVGGHAGYFDPIRDRARRIDFNRRTHDPSRNMDQYAFYEGVAFDPRRQGQTHAHESFMRAPKLPVRNPARKKRATKARSRKAPARKTRSR